MIDNNYKFLLNGRRQVFQLGYRCGPQEIAAKSKSGKFFFLIALAVFGIFWIANPAKAQTSSLTKTVKEYIDRDVDKHKWELNVNAAYFLNLGTSTITYPYVIKRNVKQKRAGVSGAWRFALSPGLGNGELRPRTDLIQNKQYLKTNYTIAPMFILGHEWGKSFGRTSLYGGVDLVGKLYFFKATAHGAKSPWEDNVYGENVIKFHRNIVWLGPFQGVKIYLNHRIAVSLESHVQFRYGADGAHTWFNDQSIGRNFIIWKEIELLSCYFLGLSYNL